MKRIVLLLMAMFAIASCSKNDDKKNETSKLNLVGTKWTATDDIAELIYGKTCTTSIEFIDDKNCQTIDIRNVRGFGSGTEVRAGIYEVKGDSVFWSDRDKNKIDNKGRVTGSIITTKQRTNKTSNVIYTKDK